MSGREHERDRQGADRGWAGLRARDPPPRRGARPGPRDQRRGLGPLAPDRAADVQSALDAQMEEPFIVETAADAARALEPIAGGLASMLFAVGLLGAAMLAASILPLSTAYSVSEYIGAESALDDRVHHVVPSLTRSSGHNRPRPARRECQEETGLIPDQLTRLGSFIPTPGYCDEEMHFFLATELRVPTDRDPVAHADEDEDIEARAFSLESIRALISSGGIIDLKTLAGLALLGQVPR